MSGYNGWTNYETWNVKLWLDNDEYTQREMERICRVERGPMAAEDALRDLVDSMRPEMEPSMFLDMLLGALSEVNWREIVENVRKNIGAGEDEDEDTNDHWRSSQA